MREILAIDSTECRVHGSLHPKAGWRVRNSTSKNAMAELHTVWSVDGCWVNDFIITGARCHDSPVSHRFNIEPNKPYVFDRDYSGFAFLLKVKAAGSHFVTRLKDYAVIDRSVKSEKTGVLGESVYKSKLTLKTSVPAERSRKRCF